MKNRKIVWQLFYVIIIIGLGIIFALLCINNHTYEQFNEVKFNDNYINITSTYYVNNNNKIKIDESKKILIINLNSNINNNDLYLKINNQLYQNNNNLRNIINGTANNSQIYIIDEKDSKKIMYLYYRYGQKTIKIKIIPTLDTKLISGSANLQEDLVINLFDGIINVESYDIKNKINIPYEESGRKTTAIYLSSDKQILHLTLKNNISNLANYITIKYSIDNQEYTSIKNIRNNPEITNNICIEVDKEIINAEHIWLELNSQNKIYKYNLK